MDNLHTPRFITFDLSETTDTDKLVNHLLSTAVSELNHKACESPSMFSGLTGTEVEKISYESLKDIARSVDLEPSRIKLISGQYFPDIIIDATHYGVEVKSTKKDSWTSTGSSIIESTRDKDTDWIYLLFAKLGGNPEFRCKPYQQCLSNIAVTHSPRYLIDMCLNSQSDIFHKMRIDYDSFRILDENEKISYVRNFFIKKAKADNRHEMPWWMGEPTNVNLSFWNDAPAHVRDSLLARAFILFPSLFQSEYKDFTLWLCANYSLLCYNTRDLFSGGGAVHAINDQKILKPYPHIVGELINRISDIKKLLYNPDEKLLASINQFWGFQPPLDNLYQIWKSRLEKEFSSNLKLSGIPISDYLENPPRITFLKK